MLRSVRDFERRVLTIGLGVATALLLAVGAAARTEQVRWTHPNPAEVQTFQVHVGSSSRAYTQTIDVGKPTRSGAGVYTYDLVVPDTAVVYLAVTATGPTQLRSAFSNEQVRNPGATGGGGTPPGGGTGAARRRGAVAVGRRARAVAARPRAPVAAAPRRARVEAGARRRAPVAAVNLPGAVEARRREADPRVTAAKRPLRRARWIPRSPRLRTWAHRDSRRSCREAGPRLKGGARSPASPAMPARGPWHGRRRCVRGRPLGAAGRARRRATRPGARGRRVTRSAAGGRRTALLRRVRRLRVRPRGSPPSQAPPPLRRYASPPRPPGAAVEARVHPVRDPRQRRAAPAGR